MKWQGRRKSENLEDRRGMSSGGKTIVGGGIIGIVILLLNLTIEKKAAIYIAAFFSMPFLCLSVSCSYDFSINQ